MVDPFATALVTLHASPLGADAVYTPTGGDPTPIRVIRSRGTDEVTGALLDTEVVSILRSDSPAVPGGSLSIDGMSFKVQRGGRLDAEGLSWTCGLVPA